jgi:hypothetical protein
MSLSYRHQRQLRLIEAGLRRSDPQLALTMSMFGRLYPSQALPAWEHSLAGPSSQDRVRRAAAWILAALTTTIVTINVLLSKAVMTVAGRHYPIQAPARDRERTRPGREADGPGQSQGR